MEKLSTLENKIVQEEYKKINAEFQKAMDIINSVMDIYGEDKYDTEASFMASIFEVRYSGEYYIGEASFGIGLMPESFQRVVKEKAISDFMENAVRLNDLILNSASAKGTV